MRVAEATPMDLDQVPASIGLEYMADVKRKARMLLSKWSALPTVNAETGKVEVVNWLEAEKIGRWSVPAIKAASAEQLEFKKLQLAIVLEQQAQQNRSDPAFQFYMMQEQMRANNPSLYQAAYPTQTSNLALPTKYSLPIIRRIYAQLVNADFYVTQAMPGPTAYLFWLDFLRATDTNNENILSVDYNWPLTPENGVPGQGQMQLTRGLLTAVKNIISVSWSVEAQEDAMAQLGLDVEQELINAFTGELARDILARQIKAIYTASITGSAQGAQLVNPWAGPNNQHQFVARSSSTWTDYKAIVYNTVIDADTDFQRANRFPSDGIVAGYGLAGFLQKLNTATQSEAPAPDNTGSLGITDYGTYAGRFKIWGTDLMPDTAGFLYKRNPDPIQASHVYAPYRPIEVMPAVYADNDATTGAYMNTDKWTRNIRERSAAFTTKPYGFQPILGPATGLSQ